MPFPRSRSWSRLALAAALALPAAPLPAQAPSVPGPSFEEVISLRGVGGIALSPDGRSVAYTVGSTEWKENRYDSEIWLAREGEAPFQLTRTEKGNSGAVRWSPDGRWIGFLADRGDKQQVYLIRAAGGEAQKVTAAKEGVRDFRWSPDGRRIAFASNEEESPAVKERREKYGEWAVEDADYRQAHLWVVDVAPDPWPSPAELPCPAKKPAADSASTQTQAPAPRCAAAPEARRLTRGADFTVGGFRWSPDGRRIAFTRAADPLINSGVTFDIAVLDVASGETRMLVESPGADSDPWWSPDGRWVLYSSLGADTTTHYYRNNHLLLVPAEGGQPRRVAADIDEQLGVAGWTPEGIFVTAWNGTQRRLHRVDPATGRARALPGAPDVIWGADFSADGRTVAFTGQGATTLTELYRTPLRDFRPVALTDMTRQIAGWPVGTAETVRWKSTDGAEIEGVLHKPAGFDPTRKYPLLVVIHGGPTGIDFPTPVTGYVYPVTQWLAKGALVLRPNYRGSAGYGEAFRSLNVRNLGVGDAWDVLSGVDHLANQGIVDTTRMGVMGWSQGGYISAFLTTTSRRFKAVSMGAGISDWTTYYVNTDVHPFTRQYLRATPWDDPEVYARTSPITYVKDAATPTLIQHGELDRRVPIANAYLLYQALHDRGVPTRLVVYKGFGHGIDKPRERLAATWHNWQWFAQHLWGETVELPIEAREGQATR